MHLKTFRVINCFGFRDSGKVDLDQSRNLIYILGRNSSGKTALLSAIEAITSSGVPDTHPRFENFDRSADTPLLKAEFTRGTTEFFVDRLTRDVWEKIRADNQQHLGILDTAELTKFRDTLFHHVDKVYAARLEALNEAATFWVTRAGDGAFAISHLADLSDVADALKSMREGIDESFYVVHAQGQPDPDVVVIRGTGYKIQLPSARDVENALAKQLPQIVRFDQRETLAENLPNGITPQDLTTASPVLSAFLDVLDRNKVNTALATHNPRPRQALVNEMQASLNVLLDEMNRSVRSLGYGDLLNITLSTFGDGLQITVETGTRSSYYRHLSDNTKLLFAYFLLLHAKHIDATILLFDEPNNGFHATAQEDLRRFLQRLADEGKQVIVSTHSEHLIDLNHLSGVRRMVTDASGNYLGVRNKWNEVTRGEGDVLAFRPIMDAIGLQFGASHLSFRDHLIVTEGPSEAYYLRAFAQIFGADDPHLVPANGDDAVRTAIALIMGQGLDFKVILDTRSHGKSAKTRLQEAYPIPDKSIYEVTVPSAFASARGSGVEDVFSKADFKQLLIDSGNPPSADFATVSNSDYMNAKDVVRVPKLVMACWFLDNVNRYTPGSFDQETQGNLERLLAFCADADWFRF